MVPAFTTRSASSSSSPVGSRNSSGWSLKERDGERLNEIMQIQGNACTGSTVPSINSEKGPVGV